MACLSVSHLGVSIHKELNRFWERAYMHLPFVVSVSWAWTEGDWSSTSAGCGRLRGMTVRHKAMQPSSPMAPNTFSSLLGCQARADRAVADLHLAMISR